MLTREQEIKLRLFESIAAHSEQLCDRGHYMSPNNVAQSVLNIYKILFPDKENS